MLWPETEARLLEADLDALVDRVKAISSRMDVYVNMAFALYTTQGPGIRNIALLVTPQGEVAWSYAQSTPDPDGADGAWSWHLFQSPSRHTDGSATSFVTTPTTRT